MNIKYSDLEYRKLKNKSACKHTFVFFKGVNKDGPIWKCGDCNRVFNEPDKGKNNEIKN